MQLKYNCNNCYVCILLLNCHRVLFKPAWMHAMSSVQLEHAMTFCSIMLDVLEPVGDQTARRSGGSEKLQLSKAIWERLLCQIRVAVVLSSRSGSSATGIS